MGFAAGIALWFQLNQPTEWLALLCLCAALALGAMALLRADGGFPFLRLGIVTMTMALAAGCLTVWGKSALVGTDAISAPLAGTFTGRVLARQEQPAEERLRLVLATREPGSARVIRVRLNVPMEHGRPGAVEGALVRVKARLMPPAPPMLPGSYNFARAAWFQGLAATGSALGPLEVIAPSEGVGEAGGWLAGTQRRLAAHIHGQLEGSAGGIAAAFASGDRGGISKVDETAMRDSGLTHLLSVSGLHVSAVMAGAYFLAMSLLALWPWLALRVRLPVTAAAVSAGAGVFYTLLTGAEVPTVRSLAGALLVLIALAIGREPLSLRLLAVAALLVMVMWPEAVVGPSFQMSFASVLAIVALHGSEPVQRFLAPHEQDGWWRRRWRGTVMLLATGMVIELALMPVALYHFHRAGIYGSLANTIAIPLTTFVTMPLIALALLFDLAGAGTPLWWLAGKSIDFLLSIARWTAAQPGAVNHLPAMGEGRFVLFLAGALWLALWRGRVRLFGLIPAGLAGLSLLLLRPPDLLISGDGRHAGITGEAGDRLLVLREGRSGYAQGNLSELSGMEGETLALADWPGAACNPDYCAIDVVRGGRTWQLLLARGMDPVPERSLAAACERSDIVIAARWLPRSCKPRWLKADRNMLDRTGGLALYLDTGQVVTVAQGQGQHGWWRPRGDEPRRNFGKARSASMQTVSQSAATPQSAAHRETGLPGECLNLNDSAAAGPPACLVPELRPADKTAGHKPSWPDRAAPCRPRGADT